MLSLITSHLLPKARKSANSVESEVYFLKLQADYYRYVAEVGSTEDRVEKAKNRALTAYNNAIKIADQMPKADPIRLSLFLNFSVYCYEIYGQKGTKKLPKKEQKAQREKAMQIAKKGLDEAEEDIGLIDDRQAGESQCVMGYLKHNL